jgi:parallel beta-helix repeat protein
MIIIILSEDSESARIVQNIYNQFQLHHILFRTTISGAIQDGLRSDTAEVHIFVEPGLYEEPTIVISPDSGVQRMTLRGISGLMTTLEQTNWKSENVYSDLLVTLSNPLTCEIIEPVIRAKGAAYDQLFILENSTLSFQFYLLEFHSSNFLLKQSSKLRIDRCKFSSCWMYTGEYSSLTCTTNMFLNTQLSLRDESTTICANNSFAYNADYDHEQGIFIAQQAKVDIDSNRFDLTHQEDPQKIVINHVFDPLYAIRGFDVTISDNIFIHCYSCIVCYIPYPRPVVEQKKYIASASLVIRDNDMSHVKLYGIRVDIPSLNPLIIGNRINLINITESTLVGKDSIVGIHLTMGCKARVINNQIDSTFVPHSYTVDTKSATIGIKISDPSTSPMVSRNSIHHCDVGVLCAMKTFGIVENNCIFENVVNLEIRESSSTNVHDNTIRDSKRVGVIISSHACPVLSNNQISSSTLQQIFIQRANPMIRYNDIKEGLNEGILVCDRAEARIDKNRICDNKFNGVYVDNGGLVDLDDNVICRNGYHGVIIDDSQMLKNLIDEFSTLNVNALSVLRRLDRRSRIHANQIFQNEDVGVYLLNIGGELLNNDIYVNRSSNVVVVFEDFFVSSRTKIEESICEQQAYKVSIDRNRIHEVVANCGVHIRCGHLIHVDVICNVIRNNNERGILLEGYPESIRNRVFSQVQICGNEIHNTKKGPNILINNCAAPRIGSLNDKDKNRIFSAREDGIRVEGVGTRVAIVNNEIHDNLGNGVNLDSAWGELEANNIYRNKMFNILLLTPKPISNETFMEVFSIARNTISAAGKSNIMLVLCPSDMIHYNMTMKIFKCTISEANEHGIVTTTNVPSQQDKHYHVVVQESNITSHRRSAICVRDSINCQIIECVIDNDSINVEVLDHGTVKFQKNKMSRKENQFAISTYDVKALRGTTTNYAIGRAKKRFIND